MLHHTFNLTPNPHTRRSSRLIFYSSPTPPPPPSPPLFFFFTPLPTFTLFKKSNPPLSSSSSSSNPNHITPKNNTTQIKQFKEEEEEEKQAPPPTTTTTLLQQMKSILFFSAPATALWICSPLMSLIDTAIIGRQSSAQLAALGPATALCDNTTYVFMFLSIATSNIIATTLAKPTHTKHQLQHNLSILLFLALTTGSLLSLLIKLLSPLALRSLFFPPPHQNPLLLPLANSYVQIRSLALPALLLGWVSQSALLGMKDSLTPLKSLLLSSFFNLLAHLLLCTCLGLGIAGAAWATTASQFVTTYLMLKGLRRKGFRGLGSLEVPSKEEVVNVLKISAPVFVSMASKVGFYSGIVYMAAGMGSGTVAAHQVLIQMFSMCVVWGEPLGQAAQTFMPGLMYGGGEGVVVMLKGLLGMGVATGLAVAEVGTGVLWKGAGLFSRDQVVRSEMGRVLLQFFVALVVTPCTHCVEGTLLAGREGGFLSMVMAGCLVGGLGLLWLAERRGLGLVGCWMALCVFQWARFLISFGRVLSPRGVVFSPPHRH